MHQPFALHMLHMLLEVLSRHTSGLHALIACIIMQVTLSGVLGRGTWGTVRHTAAARSAWGPLCVLLSQA